MTKHSPVVLSLLVLVSVRCRAEDLPRPANGSLFIVGGGKISDSLRQRFVDLAGTANGRLVVIPTASESADRPNAGDLLEPWSKYRFASLDLLHTRSRVMANDPAFSAAIDRATAAWVGGGDQSRIAAAYLGTAVEKKLHALLKRGGAMGGTSAGAAIMTRLMITGGRDKATIGTGFDFLPGAVVDQHFLTRNRKGRLEGLLSQHAGLVGFGIDEGTALIVRGSAVQVAGASVVTVMLAGTSNLPPKSIVLKPGSISDLVELQKLALERARSEPSPKQKATSPRTKGAGSSKIVDNEL